jgi:hypothetical protein
MDMTQGNKPHLKLQVDEIMKSLPELRKRIGGKTLPREKLALNMSDRYFQEGSSLVLPGYELFYFMNIMSNTGGLSVHLDPMIQQIQGEIDTYEKLLEGQFDTSHSDNILTEEWPTTLSLSFNLQLF